jgi:hypothetical protein
MCGLKGCRVVGLWVLFENPLYLKKVLKRGLAFLVPRVLLKPDP